jgi:hypothetical protein
VRNLAGASQEVGSVGTLLVSTPKDVKAAAWGTTAPYVPNLPALDALLAGRSPQWRVARRLHGQGMDGRSLRSDGEEEEEVRMVCDALASLHDAGGLKQGL